MKIIISDMDMYRIFEGFYDGMQRVLYLFDKYEYDKSNTEGCIKSDDKKESFLYKVLDTIPAETFCLYFGIRLAIRTLIGGNTESFAGLLNLSVSIVTLQHLVKNEKQDAFYEEFSRSNKIFDDGGSNKEVESEVDSLSSETVINSFE